MELVTKKYQGRAEFWFIYCREAHPDGDPNFKTTTKKGEKIKQAMTMEERKATALEFCNDMKATRRILVDEFTNGGVQRQYGGLPNPTIVIDIEGKMALKLAWTNGKTLDGFLERFLAGGSKYDAELARKVPQGGPTGPAFRKK